MHLGHYQARRLWLPTRFFFSVLLLLALGCARLYPRRSTPALPFNGQIASDDDPENLWRVRIVRAWIPGFKNGAAWDDDGTAPDVVVRLLQNGKEVVTTPALQSLEPRFDFVSSHNLLFSPDDDIKIEIRDADLASEDWIGDWKGRGLPKRLQAGADAHVSFGKGGVVVLRLERPSAYRGTGITTYEVRDDKVKIVALERFSPAGRAGLEPGDAITKIDAKDVTTYKQKQIESELALAYEKQLKLTIEKGDGHTQEVTIDSGFMWPMM